MPRFKGFIGPTYSLSSLNADCQRCVNLFPELDELHTAADGEIASLQMAPGERLLATLGTGPIRGSWLVSTTGRAFVVSGNRLYEVYANWTSILRGTVTNTTGPVQMADNGLQLFVPDGLYGFVLNLATNVFTQVTAAGFFGGISPIGQDSYIILAKPGTDQFYISGLNDATAWDALDIQSMGGIPDLIVACSSVHRQLWLFGKRSTQVWWNTGGADFPFARIDGATSEYGCSAAFSVQRVSNSLVWLGGGPSADGQVFMSNGYQPQRISNHSVETSIAAVSDVSTSTSWTYTHAGHTFYVLNLPGASTSWCYDLTTQQWHERAYWYQGDYQRHRADNCTLAFNTQIVGDYSTGNLYALDSATYTDNGNPLIWMRRSPHVSADMKRLFFSRAQFDLEMGVGLDGIAQGTDPQIFLRYSDDFGHTWSHEKQASYGKLGEYRKRAIFSRLGSSRTRVFELRGSDPVKTRIMGAELDIDQGVS